MMVVSVASRLRYTSPESKALIVSEVEKNVWPAIVAGNVKSLVYRYFPLSEVVEAHWLMGRSKHIGKMLLVP
jgi:NADPH:quinone reductase-like Zn-dependent oxidoreductase